jgi:glycosyltransferase involved in cell wall biosynthesis
MAEVQTENQSQQNQINEHNTIIDSLIDKLNSNNFKIYYYCPPMNTPSGGIGVIFRQAKILKDAGFNVTIIYEPRQDTKASYQESQKKAKKIEIFERFKPDWIGKDADGIKLQPLGNSELKFNDGTTEKVEILSINPEDFVIIPEGFPNVMERFTQIPCKKIVFAQSWYYILNAMGVGQSWKNWGIEDVISISDGITEYINIIMPGMRIKNYSQSIDRDLFKPKSISQKFPKIAFMPGRTQDSILKTYNVIKTFYAFYPQYRWIRFDELKGLSKEEFANRLAESSMALYTDEIAGFGTMPLEAMACNTHVVGWTPLGGKEYMNGTNGFWAHNGEIFQLAELLGIAAERLLTGMLDEPAVIEEYNKTLERYTPEKEKESILQIYKEYKNERIEELKKLKQ